MPSPFPGMNPYLEQESIWHSFHEQFPPYCQEMLNAQIRPKYFVKLDTNIYIHEMPEGRRVLTGRPDVAVGQTSSGMPSATTTVLTAPVVGQLESPVDIVQETFLEICHRQTRRVVTVIELLSPTNKIPGPDREDYIAKRRRYAHSNIHLVEIDLLRGWPRMPVAGLPPCDYCVLVSPAQDRPTVGLWPLSLREPLPIIPIPLLDGDPPAQLDLQALLHRLYDAGGYDDYIYDGVPAPPLAPEQQAWVESLLKKRS